MTFLQEELGVAQASLREKNVAVSFTLYPISSRNSTGKWHSAQVRNLTLALEGFTRQRDNELAGVSGRDDFLKFYFNTILALYTAQRFLIHAGFPRRWSELLRREWPGSRKELLSRKKLPGAVLETDRDDHYVNQ